MIQISLSLMLVAAITSGCVTSSDTPTATRKVIDRSPGLEEPPAWIKAGNKFTTGEGRVAYRGFLTMEPDSRPEACTHAAGTEGKGRIAAMIASSIVDESGISGDDKTLVYNRLTAVLAKQKLPGIEVADEYWNLVESDDGDNPPVRRLECWAKVTIKKTVLDSALNKAMHEFSEDASVAKHAQRLEQTEEKLRKEEGL